MVFHVVATAKALDQNANAAREKHAIPWHVVASRHRLSNLHAEISDRISIGSILSETRGWEMGVLRSLLNYFAVVIVNSSNEGCRMLEFAFALAERLMLCQLGEYPCCIL